MHQALNLFQINFVMIRQVVGLVKMVNSLNQFSMVDIYSLFVIILLCWGHIHSGVPAPLSTTF